GSKRITPSTAAVLSMAAVTPLVWDAELDSVRTRLDSLKGKGDGSGAWSTVYSKRSDLSTEAGAGAEQTLTGLTVGMDARSERESSMTTRGVFFSYSHSDVGFDRGGKGNVDSYGAGAYAGWEHRNGAYVDGVVKVNRFAHTVRGRMSGGGAADGDYSLTGAGGHAEAGWRWRPGDGNWHVTPYAGFTGFATDSQVYGLSNGMRAEVDTTRLLRGEAGVKADWRMRVKGVEP
ncbi:autotransporter outer membrane beta-barrel domain-containing protein, partial [Escherichia coli]